ncbi:hypothetical protein IscW_ISCW002866 [Ixodes scapularis]|uniref:Uncharacterized protein n=1 Tax=Ixodes scapularis TaxID=6945 RepID=B7P7H5_IXOSC|nr:hypothetical protein IscW_ISCW002866 [Ixodes scapularis]|eukprot:XP_002399216.1 hypothetical protein IscW_ISCW002866 [Ixodes scapularis]
MYCLLEAGRDVTLESYVFPPWTKFIGWSIVGLGLAQIFVFAYSALYVRNFKFSEAFRPIQMWGPEDPDTFGNYMEFLTARGYIAEAGLPSTVKPNVLIKENRGTAKPMEQPFADKEKELVAKAKMKEAVIRRMSVALGQPPNKLRKAALLHERRKTLMATRVGVSPSEEDTPSAPSSLPVLEIEPLPAEGTSSRRQSSQATEDPGSLNGRYSEFPPLSACPDDAPRLPSTAVLLSRVQLRVPQELPGIEYSEPFRGRTSLTRPSIGLSRQQLEFSGPSMPLNEHKRRLSLMPPRAIGDTPDLIQKDGRSILCPTNQDGQRMVRTAKGRISIMDGPEECQGSMTPQENRKFGTWGSHGIKERLLRRPSIKLTVLEPVESDNKDPEAREKMMAEQIERALSNLRRKSMAMSLASQKPSMAGPSTAGSSLRTGQLHRISEASDTKDGSEGQSFKLESQALEEDQHSILSESQSQ